MAEEYRMPGAQLLPSVTGGRERLQMTVQTIFCSSDAFKYYHMCAPCCAAEWEPQERVWMGWPQRTDVWRDGAEPARTAFVQVSANHQTFGFVSFDQPFR